MIRCVSAVVRVIPHSICGTVILSVSVENGIGGSSAGCISSTDQSIVRPSSRGGVPVFKRPSGNDILARRVASIFDGASPIRPACVRSLPRWISPPRNVPVVRTTLAAVKLRPSSQMTPLTCLSLTTRSPTAASMMVILSSSFRNS